MYTDNVPITVYPFTRQDQGNEIIIGNPQTGVFLAVPPEAVEVLEALADGRSIREASALYEQKYGETADIREFVELLRSKGMVEFAGEEKLTSNETVPTARANRRYHFTGFPQGLAKMLFGKLALSAYLILPVVAISAILHNPSIAPGPRDLFFPDHRALTWSLLVLYSLASVFIHEFAHLIAACAKGVNSRIGISTRLWDLVAETDLTGLWALPKQQRYLPILAGILIDSASVSVLILVCFAQQTDVIALSSFSFRLVRALAFIYLMRIAWEFYLFMRTDLYFVVATIFNCKSLLSDTENFLRNQLARFFSSVRTIDQSVIPDREMRVIRAYGWVWIAGRVWAVTTFLWVTVPLCVGYTRNVAAALKTGYAADPANFLDAVALAAYFLLPTALGLVLWSRSFMVHERKRI